MFSFHESTQMFQLEDVCLSLLWFFILSTFSSRLSPYVWTDIKSVCVFVCVLTYIKSRCGEKNMCGLGDICSMEAVVVRYVSMVMVLQGHHVSDKGVNWDTKCLQQLSLLRRSETEEEGVHRVHEHRHKQSTFIRLFFLPGRWRTWCSWEVCCWKTLLLWIC